MVEVVYPHNVHYRVRIEGMYRLAVDCVHLHFHHRVTVQEVYLHIYVHCPVMEEGCTPIMFTTELR